MKAYISWVQVGLAGEGERETVGVAIGCWTRSCESLSSFLEHDIFIFVAGWLMVEEDKSWILCGWVKDITGHVDLVEY